MRTDSTVAVRTVCSRPICPADYSLAEVRGFAHPATRVAKAAMAIAEERDAGCNFMSNSP
jgi:hypothetical protein